MNDFIYWIGFIFLSCCAVAGLLIASGLYINWCWYKLKNVYSYAQLEDAVQAYFKDTNK